MPLGLFFDKSISGKNKTTLRILSFASRIAMARGNCFEILKRRFPLEIIANHQRENFSGLAFVAAAGRNYEGNNFQDNNFYSSSFINVVASA
jgi:hypothetical protein